MLRLIHKKRLAIAAVFTTVLLAGDATTVRKPDVSALFTEPRDIRSRDLFYGPGGKKHAPRTTQFTFVKEDSDGTNPKYIVMDADGATWKIKLGVESKPETAASRFLWASGFYAHEIYFLRKVSVSKMPEKLRRGKKLVGPGGSMQDVRLMRLNDKEKKIETWKWRKVAFKGSKEFDGLRVLMAVMNNWDLKDTNNAIYEDESGRQRYMVSDLGGTFGTTGITWSKDEWKGNLEAYRKSKFLKSVTPEFVNFANPARPAIVGLLAPRNYFQRIRMRWIGKDIPREHARWMGDLLGRLSPAQIRDAFRAGGFTPEEVEGFAEVMEIRIAVLKAL